MSLDLLRTLLRLSNLRPSGKRQNVGICSHLNLYDATFQKADTLENSLETWTSLDMSAAKPPTFLGNRFGNFAPGDRTCFANLCANFGTNHLLTN